jgi:hypothetical protein
MPHPEIRQTGEDRLAALDRVRARVSSLAALRGRPSTTCSKAAIGWNDPRHPWAWESFGAVLAVAPAPGVAQS